MLPDRDGRRLQYLHGAHVRGDDRARDAPYHDSTGRRKKRRRGGDGGSGGNTRAKAVAYNGLLPESEWEYVVAQYAEAFGQDPWRVSNCEPHGRPELIWYWYYHLEESRRIDELRRELDDFDRATLTGVCVNGDEKQFKARYGNLERRLRNDPQQPAKPKWTPEEMQAAAQRLVSHVLATGKLPPKKPVS